MPCTEVKGWRKGGWLWRRWVVAERWCSVHGTRWDDAGCTYGVVKARSTVRL